MTIWRPYFVTLGVLVVVLLGGLSSFVKGEANLRCVCGLKNHNSQKLNIMCGKTDSSVAGAGDDNRVSCEKETVSYVPEGYEYLRGLGFYKLYRTSKKYSDALQHCKNDGAHLAIPDSKDEADALANMLVVNKAVNEAFLGINDIASEGDFVSVLGTSILSLGYQLWTQGNPDNAGQIGEDCLTLNKKGLYNDANCEWGFAFLCEKPLTKAVPEGYTFYPGVGFYKHYLSPTPYDVAEKRCKEDGGYLVVPKTYEEAQILIRMYDNYLEVKESLVGITDTAKEGTFVTVTGKTVSSLEFRNWGTGEPNNNAVGGENCVTLHVAGTLNDISCAKPKAFFCEIPMP